MHYGVLGAWAAMLVQHSRCSVAPGWSVSCAVPTRASWHQGDHLRTYQTTFNHVLLTRILNSALYTRCAARRGNGRFEAGGRAITRGHYAKLCFNRCLSFFICTCALRCAWCLGCYASAAQPLLRRPGLERELCCTNSGKLAPGRPFEDIPNNI